MAGRGAARQGTARLDMARFFLKRSFMTNEIRAIGNRHPLTVALINKLSLGKPGDCLSDDDLFPIIRLKTGVGNQGYNYLLSAIKYCETTGVIWNRVPKENKIICMNSEEIAERSKNDLHGIKRKVKRSSRRLAWVEIESLPMEKRSSVLATSAILGAMAIMSKPESIKKLIGNNQAKPQIGDAFKLFE